MPWKGEKDPYRIWLSEIILQQTRVEQGLQYYDRFIRKFPTINDLALANENEVFKLWEGLGYYSRCRNLIATAKFIFENLNGEFPSTFNEILKLKGIGPYTASAIASFAYNLPHAVVDGNVFRVLARVFDIDTPIDTGEGKKEFSYLANELLDKKNAGIYNQAIMDFGATVCKPALPNCADCVFRKTCKAYLNNTVDLLPKKSKKLSVTQRYFSFLIIEFDDKIAIRERTSKDIWRHLFDFPLIESSSSNSFEIIKKNFIHRGWMKSNTELQEVQINLRQKLTHQQINASFYKVVLNHKPRGLETYLWIKPFEINNYAFPKVINHFIEENRELFQCSKN